MRRALAFFLVMGPVLLACGGLAGGDTSSEPSYAADIEPIFAKRCGDCHSAGEAKAHLILDPGRGYEDLVGKAAFQVPGMQLVKPGDPANSYLWKKLDHSAREGKGMPRTLFGSKKLPNNELELIRAWIETGARP
jgi:hypothetical protein